MTEDQRDLLKFVVGTAVPYLYLSWVFRPRRLHPKVTDEQLIEVAEILKKQDSAIEYLMNVLDKNNVPLDSFDVIALRQFDIEVTLKEEPQ